MNLQGQTFRSLGFDFTRTFALATLNAAANGTGLLVRLGSPDVPFPLGSSVVGATTTVLPFNAALTGAGGFWFSAADVVWVADQGTGLNLYRQSATTGAWTRVNAWRTPDGQGARTVSGRGNTLYVSSYTTVATNATFVFGVTVGDLLAGTATAPGWKRLVTSPANTFVSDYAMFGPHALESGLSQKAGHSL